MKETIEWFDYPDVKPKKTNPEVINGRLKKQYRKRRKCLITCFDRTDTALWDGFNFLDIDNEAIGMFAEMPRGVSNES